jgi:hypothetical protein
MTIFNLLRTVCQTLEKLDIPYMVSGSLVLNIYAVSRMTRDIDIVIALKEIDITNFCAEFPNERYYCHRPSIEDSVKRQSMFNIIDGESGYKIDFIIQKNTKYRTHEFNRRQRNNSFGFDAWIVSVEDLILSKLIWIQELQSDRQLDDIKNLLSITTVDREYIQEWIKELKLNTFNLNL